MHKLKTMTKAINRNFSLILASAVLLAGLSMVVASPERANAACAAPSAPYGTVTAPTITLNADQAGTYRVTARIMAPDTISNSFTLDIGDNNCGIKVGDSATIAPNTWTWVDYKNGATNTNTKIDVVLAAGTHTVKMYGTEPGVKVDRVLLMKTSAICSPRGTGDNCTEITPPVVTLNAPAPNAIVNGATVRVSAIATDNFGISRVDFFRGADLIGTDITPATTPDVANTYSVLWDTLSVTNPVPNGRYSLTAKAYDQHGNEKISLPVEVTVANSDTTKPTQPTNLRVVMASGTVTPQANLTWTASTDSGGVTGYDIYRGGTFLKTVTGTPVPTSTTDAPLVVGQTYSYYVIAKDGAGNASDPSAPPVSITVPDTTVPTVSVDSPADGETVSGTVTVTATADDDIGVTRVQFFVDGVLRHEDTTEPYTFSWNTNTVNTPNGTHTIAAESFDAANNPSLRDTNTVTVQNGETTPPTVPENFRTTATAYNRVDLSWDASTDASGIKNYLLVRNGVSLPFLGPDAISFSDTGTIEVPILPSTTYSYQLYAIDNANNYSLTPATLAATTPAAPTAPFAPTSLTAGATSANQIDLRWDASSGNPSAYDIYRGTTTDTSTYTKIISVTGSTTSFGNTGLNSATTYYYYVKATNSIGSSPPSNTANATTQTPPSTTGTVTGIVTSSKSNAPLGMVYVSVYYNGSRHSVRTGGNGQYTLTGIPVGTYSIKYRRRGHNTLYSDATITADSTLTKNINLIAN